MSIGAWKARRTENSAPSGSTTRWFLPALLVSTATLKLFLAWRFAGFLTGDDTEVVETAASSALGLDYRPWAIRSLFHPLVLARPFVELGALAGLRGPRWATFLADLPTILFSTAGIVLVFGLARRLGWSERAARASTFLYAVHWLPLAFGSTSFPRPISTCLLLGAFLLASPSESSPRLLAAAGALAAAAFAVRWSEVVVLPALAAFARIRGRTVRSPAVLIAGFGAGALAFAGVFDAMTWGRPFASLMEFARLTRDPTLGGFVPRPWYWYASMLLQWAGPVLVFLAVFAWRERRSRLPIAIACSIVLLLSFSPIKQPRYLQAVVPFCCLAAGLGWERLRASGTASRRWATLLLIAAAALGLERTLHLLRGKSQAAVAAARFLASVHPSLRRVTLEQAWAYGERLYLGGSVSIRDLPPRAPLPADAIASAARDSEALALYESDVEPAARTRIESAGFESRRFQADRSRAVLVFIRPERAYPDSAAGAAR